MGSWKYSNSLLGRRGVGIVGNYTCEDCQSIKEWLSFFKATKIGALKTLLEKSQKAFKAEVLFDAIKKIFGLYVQSYRCCDIITNRCCCHLWCHSSVYQIIFRYLFCFSCQYCLGGCSCLFQGFDILSLGGVFSKFDLFIYARFYCVKNLYNKL